MKLPDTTISISPRNDFIIIKIPVCVIQSADEKYWEMLAENSRKLAVRFAPTTWGKP